jgi:hypothetical protein
MTSACECRSMAMRIQRAETKRWRRHQMIDRQLRRRATRNNHGCPWFEGDRPDVPRSSHRETISWLRAFQPWIMATRCASCEAFQRLGPLIPSPSRAMAVGWPSVAGRGTGTGEWCSRTWRLEKLWSPRLPGCYPSQRRGCANQPPLGSPSGMMILLLHPAGDRGWVHQLSLGCASRMMTVILLHPPGLLATATRLPCCSRSTVYTCAVARGLFTFSTPAAALALQASFCTDGISLPAMRVSAQTDSSESAGRMQSTILTTSFRLIRSPTLR